MDEKKTYEDGLRDGRMEMIETILKDQKGRLDNHSGRIRMLERGMWCLLGAGILLEIWPRLQTVFNSTS